MTIKAKAVQQIDTELQTTVFRVALALIVAAALASLFLTVDYLYGIYSQLGPQHLAQYGLSKGTFAFLFGLAVWLLGLVVFGCPVWAVLHRTGRRGWQYAVGFGFTIPFLVILGHSTGFFDGSAGNHWSYFGDGGQQWIDGSITRFGLYMAFRTSTVAGAIGAVQGLIIWFLAYRRVAKIGGVHP